MATSMIANRSIWDDLVHEGTSSGGFLRLRVAGKADWALYAATQQPSGCYALLLEAPTQALRGTTSKPLEFPRLRGVAIAVTAIKPGPSGRVRIEVVLSDLDFRDVFAAFALPIRAHVEASSLASEALGALVSQLHRWQRFLEIFGAKPLGEDAQIGLYGELLTLVEIATFAGFEEAVRSWTGPAGAAQDFQLRGIVLEVKTTRAGPPHVLRITSINQLDPADDVWVFLRHIHLDRRRGSLATLPALVMAVRAAIDASAAQVRVSLESRLLDAGYLDAHASEYSENEYAEHDAMLLEVRDEFPRLRRQQLPLGVGNLRYDIQLAACTTFSVPHSSLNEAIGR